MTNSQTLLSVILLQQGFFALWWVIAARLRLARRPAGHWALASAAVAGAMSLILARGSLSPWLGIVLANVLVAVNFVAIRRGVQVFAQLPATDREHALLLLAVTAALALSVADGVAMIGVVLASSLSAAWVLLRAGQELRAGLRDEFGALSAAWCAVPLVGLGLLFGARGVMALVEPAVFAGRIDESGAGNTGVVFGSLAFSLVLHSLLIAMVVLRLVRRLQYQSDHDLLTHLLGRRPMERLLLAEAQRQERFGGSYAMLSVDIDHFKRINDRFGHAVGDVVLVRVAQALRDGARQIDSVARMGGEEFGVLLPGADAAGAESVAQRLLEVVRDLRFTDVDTNLRVTVSIGLLVVHGAAEPLQDMQRRLDRALYEAKRTGRDRVVAAASLAL